MKKQRVEKYSWVLFEKDAAKMAAWAKRKKIGGVYGIPRGGLVLAVKLSHLTGIPFVAEKNKIGKNTLVVDDIVDGGKTMGKLLSSLRKKPPTASIYFEDGAKFTPDFYVREKKGVWVIFPWES